MSNSSHHLLNTVRFHSFMSTDIFQSFISLVCWRIVTVNIMFNNETEKADPRSYVFKWVSFF